MFYSIVTAAVSILLFGPIVMYWLLGIAPQLPPLDQDIGRPEIVDGLLIDPAFDGRFTSRQEYLDSLAVGLKKCDSIPVYNGEFFDGINPDGSAFSAWNRSSCYQRLAVEYHSPEVCNNVWRRYSIFRQSWRFSEPTCRCKVQGGRQDTSADIYKQIHRHRDGGMRLVEITTTKSGNGARYELPVKFVGTQSGSYRIQIYLLDEQGYPQQILLRDLDIPNKFGEYNLGVSRDAILEIFPDFRPGKSIPTIVVNTLTLEKFGAVDPGWINSAWPASTRSQFFKAELDF